MAIIDKNNVLSNITSDTHVTLELGCGNRKRNSCAIGIDILDYPDVDIVGDIYEVMASFSSASVDAVYSYHFIEHVSDVPKLLTELARVIKPNGYLEFVAPHFSNPYFYSDPTHKNFFGLYTFCYLADASLFSRQVPSYGYKAEFEIVKIDLIFKSIRPFIFRNGFKRLIGSFFNSCTYLQELYEENFCYLLPCYEVRYELRKKP